ncbi:hypothetical protein PVAP13_4NG213800 [Panicum virgatum]|uniref:Uncharacterized protein n=1 Tax=Panicum virgatum TaxID=38727 RepID=A0A8T0TB53_PANVG|nr:hypothetical protein PVAP13_4NG213800 [Panicum virgatum]
MDGRDCRQRGGHAAPMSEDRAEVLLAPRRRYEPPCRNHHGEPIRFDAPDFLQGACQLVPAAAAVADVEVKPWPLRVWGGSPPPVPVARAHAAATCTGREMPALRGSTNVLRSHNDAVDDPCIHPSCWTPPPCSTATATPSTAPTSTPSRQTPPPCSTATSTTPASTPPLPRVSLLLYYFTFVQK